TCTLLLMMSGGGRTTLEIAARFTVRLVESGPAGGALLSSWIARERALERVLSFDMGGTTAKICLIDQGEPERARTFEVARAYRNGKGSGLPVRVPVIEVVEIGAGGGEGARARDRRGEPGHRRARARDRTRPGDRALHDDRVRGRRAAARGPARGKARGASRRRARGGERGLGDRVPARSGLVPGGAQPSR